MTYQIVFTTAAAREIRKLPRLLQGRILDAIQDLGADPRPHGSKKLVGETSAWRIRVGDYRVIYEVLDEVMLITVVRARHRREVYAR
ncbi:MAG: type II toxin-antitoxin system RelE/ParE family toxin [Propionibacteriaceae bacterium]|nr:type II toxin-antitoxin system RelE/ParE family toxin [Micropruina sp.]